MKEIMLLALIISAASCKNTNPKDVKVEEQNEATFDESRNEKDVLFLVKAAELNREAISLGQLAQQKSAINSVQELGKMMEEEHTKSLSDLIALAQKKKISLPTSQIDNKKAEYKKLSGKSGTDFGKEYSSFMINEHKDAITLFEIASAESTDPEIRDWATKTLPLLKRHLDQSFLCLKHCENYNQH